MAWLPLAQDWSARLSSIGREGNLAVWRELVALAQTRMDFGETLRLDRALMKRFPLAPPEGLETRPLRVALLGSSTVEHLMPGLRVAALRHGLWISVHAVDYGQYLQAISDTTSSLYQFAPEVVLFAFDAAHLFVGAGSMTDAAGADSSLNQAAARVEEVWRLVKSAFNCIVVQQTLLPTALPLLGGNEHELPGSRLRLIRRFNERLREIAGAAGVDLLTLDEQVSQDGLAVWHDPVLWHKAKQEIAPLAVPMYGEKVARLLAARQGRSAKCLVLDLDNTLWGGVIGDDGLEGIKLGQGSALGEAYLAVQRYALELSHRGIILAVCSKNDEAVALSPFESHPEMILRRSDIACFVANWADKATNLRRIAAELNIGLDSLVFLDDNPFERNQVRQELPMVRVLELPEEPALYPLRVAEAGCFEAVTITADDAERAQRYQASLSRET
jgi:HAD superfamily phosphatase (TIGR01681 family)